MKRNSDEDFKDYKKRRCIANSRLKSYLKGHIIWNNGTYIKKKNGKIGHERINEA